MKIFWSFARHAFHTTAIYTFDFWLQLINSFIFTYSIYWLWVSLYAQRKLAFGVDLDQMITYGILGIVLDFIFVPGYDIVFYIAAQVKSGEIQTDLLKPLDYQFYLFARSIGQTLFSAFLLGLPSLLVGYFFLGFRLPINLATGLLFIASVSLGYIVLFLLSFLLGMMAIFTINIFSIAWAYNALVGLLSGQEIPLWLFPLFLSQVANLLPFKYVYSIPMSIYINKFSTIEILNGFLMQIFWICLLLLASRLVWKRAYAKMIVQGG